MSSAHLTGRWIGHYIQQGKEYPISADVLETDERLSGFMYDGAPDRHCSVAEAVAQAGLPPEAEEEIAAKIRELAPDAPTGPIGFVSRLPTHSILQGRRTGRTVYFLKGYQGTSFSGYQVGDRLIGTEKRGHDVHYEGQLSRGGQVLEGRWWIDADPEQGTPLTEGRFLLRRSETGAPSGQGSGGGENERRPWWKFWA
jgi:hypothetical protein